MGKDRIIANLFTEAVDWWSLVQKKVLKISQSSQENTCARVFFKWSCRYRPATLLKTRLWYKYFLVNFAKFLRASLFMIHLRWMLLFSVIRQISQVWKKKKLWPFRTRNFQKSNTPLTHRGKIQGVLP